MTKQKFRKGNLAKLKRKEYGYDIGTEVIINERNKSSDHWDYGIIVLKDGNECAWTDEDNLEYVTEGGRHLFKQAKMNHKTLSKRNTDINFILECLDRGELYTESVEYLLDLIGHKSTFYVEGSFYHLYNDMKTLYPLFIHIKNAKTLDEAKEPFIKHGLIMYNVDAVYDAFHNREYRGKNKSCSEN